MIDGDFTRTYIFQEDGSIKIYENGKFISESISNIIKCEDSIVYVYNEEQWVPTFYLVQGGMMLAQPGGRTVYYPSYKESTEVQGCLHFDVANDEKYINNGELTLPEKWIGDDGLEYVTCEVYINTSEREDIKSAVIPNNGQVYYIGSEYIEEIKVKADNQNYSVEDGVLYNKDKTTLVVYPGGKKDTTFRIPDSVTSVEYFYDGQGNESSGNNSYVTTLIIPRSLDFLDYNSFSAISTIFPSLTTINYEGTEEEWENNFGSAWGDIEVNFEYTP